MAHFLLRGRSFDFQQKDFSSAVQGTEPGPIRLYTVRLHNKRYPIKQVVSLTTGISVAEFTAHDAYRILKRLGFQIDTAQKKHISKKGGPDMRRLSDWLLVWRELRDNLRALPRCTLHPSYPCVESLAHRVVNDIITLEESGIRVRSHRTLNEDFIEENRFRIWWNHLVDEGSASLFPGGENNPHPWRSRIVGAILAAGLPDRINTIGSDTIELIQGG